jgi:hypothetical protein
MYSVVQLQAMLLMDEKSIINNNASFRQQVQQLLDSLHSYTSRGQYLGLCLLTNRKYFFV